MRARIAGAAVGAVIAVLAALTLWPDSAGSNSRFPAIVSAQTDGAATPDDLVGRTIGDAGTIADLVIWLAEHADARPDEIDRLAAVDPDEQVVYAIVEETCPNDRRPTLVIDEGRRRFEDVVDQTCTDGWTLAITVFAVDEAHRAALDEPAYEG